MVEETRDEPRPEDAKGLSDATTRTSLPSESPSVIIDRYRLLQKIGEGGMGEVWLAEQNEPVRRRVALKIIKAGMDSRQVVARFEAERQALAMMDHPAIAKVFDAGTTPRGLPYFVMEYVQGVSITWYCDSQRLDTRERLELFERVCEGVQHAHQKGIIHRDLKPSNVLVELQEGRPAPRIIDFGVAKATGGRLTERTLYTELGVMIGTPEYMSPEQAELTHLDVDTRTDVYSLGAMLYELLTGELPFDPRQLRLAGFDELRRRIREVEPPRPSTRVRTLGDRSDETARKRRTDPGRLVSRLRGDLDWIVMKALHKDRTRRYGSPAELASDIERHLKHLPVLAGPPGKLYLVSKFVRRNRALVGTVVAVIVALAAGLVVSTLQYLRAEAARGDAVLARDDAIQQASKAEAVTRFLQEMLASTSPDQAKGRQVTVRQALDAASVRIETAFPNEPLTEAAVRRTIGITYWALGDYDRAEPHFRRALAIRTTKLGPDHPDVAELQVHLARLLNNRGERAEAETLLRASAKSASAFYGEDHAATLEALNTLGYVLWGQGNFAEAEGLHRHALAARRRLFGEENVATLRSMMNLGMDLRDTMRYEEAEQMFREGLAISRRLLGDEDRISMHFLNQLGEILAWQEKFEEAEPLLRQALESRLRIYGEDHQLTTETLIPLGNLHYMRKEYREAESFIRRALAINERMHTRTEEIAKHLMVRILVAQGKLTEAHPYWVDYMAEGLQAVSMPGATAQQMNEFAWLLLTIEPVAWRDPATALRFAQRAAAAPDGGTPRILDTLALAWFTIGDFARAVESQQKALSLLDPSSETMRATFATRLARYREAAAGRQPGR